MIQTLSRHFPANVSTCIYEYSLEAKTTILMQTIIQTADCLIFQLRLGRPKPKAKCDENTLVSDHRPRVLLPGQSGLTCSIIALRMLMDFIGEKPSVTLRHIGFYEMALSDRLEAHDKMLNELPLGLRDIFIEKGFIVLSKITRNRSTLHDSALVPFYNDFLTTHHTNFHTFAMCVVLRRRHTIDADYLKKIRHEPAIMFAEALEKDPGTLTHWINYYCKTLNLNVPTKTIWENLPIEIQAIFIELFAIRATAQVFGLKKSTWRPDMPIKSLMAELKKNGPLYIQYTMCHPFFQNPSIPICTIAKRIILGWKKPSTQLNKSTAGAHAGLIIGVENSSRRVFFITTEDPSDPKAPTKQRIFALPLEIFQKILIPIGSLWHNTLPVTEETQYAWASNRFKPIL